VKTYRLSELAERDLDDAWRYVALETGTSRADRLIDQITKRLALLAAYPNAGRLRDDLGVDARSFTVANYVIYYRAHEGGVLVSRVLHGKRDQAAALGTEPTES